jgi:RNA polymerase sigma factor (sigma-70 family)
VKDYRITIKARNNRILKAVEESGHTFGGNWCRSNGVNYASAVRLVAMTLSPIDEDGHLIKAANQLCEALNKTPDDLWSKEQIYPLEKNFSELEMDHDQVISLLPHNQQFIEHDTSGLENEQAKTVLAAAMRCSLKSREIEVLRLIFYEDFTLQECADRLNVTKERVRQIEQKALRKMRHPGRLPMLVDLLDVDPKERAIIKSKEESE